MNELRQLMNIIRRKDENETLTPDEERILNNYYNEYINNVHPEKEDGSIKTREDISMLELFEYVSQPMVEKKKKIEEINMFKTLLKYKGTLAKLSELYKSVYTGVYTNEEIESNIKNPEIMEEFFKKLNGAIIEESVFGVDMSGFNPEDFGTINATITEFDDPVLFVKTLKPVELYEVDLSKNDNVTILTFPDLHLEAGCYTTDALGNTVIDQDKLNEKLIAFINFRDDIIMKLRSEGIDVTGVVYTGDILETFVMGANSNEDARITRINNLVDSFIKFEEDAKKGKIIKDESLRLQSNDGYFVAYLAGNHDIKIGREAFNKIMELFGNAAGKDVVDLGNGSARISVGGEFLSFMHHQSFDWNTKVKEDMILRKIKNGETYHFEEYFRICEAYFNTPEFQERMNQNPEKDPISLLMDSVNQKMKDENPRLYHAFLPYIITNAEKEGTYLRASNPENGIERIIIQKDIPFFRNFIEFESIGNIKRVIKRTKLENGNQVGISLEPEHFTTFVENSTDLGEMSYTERLNEASAEYIEYLKSKGKNDIAQELEKVIHKIIPIFGRTDKFSSIVYSLSHFHRQPKSVADTVGERLTNYTNVDSPIVYLEGTSKPVKDSDVNLGEYESFEGDRTVFTTYVELCNRCLNQEEVKSEFEEKQKDPNFDEIEFIMTITNEYIREEAKKAIAEYRVNGARFASTRKKSNFETLINLHYAVENYSQPNIDKYIEDYSQTLVESGMSVGSEQYKERMQGFRTAVAEMPKFKDYLAVEKTKNGSRIVSKPRPSTLSTNSNNQPLSEPTREANFTAGVISINTSCGEISKISLKALMAKVILLKINSNYLIETKITEGSDYNRSR